MKNSGVLFTFLMKIGAVVKKEPDGRQVAARHGMIQGRHLAYTERYDYTTQADQTDEIN